ncbi:MAG TPA: hypothetical protein VMX17_06325 [Candidatus Glassbacteria bacterium]|nr:hypothetical protein [Candidatus Glassbacteria bacterium]
MTRITKKNFKEALKNTGGNQSRIAEKLEVSRQAVSLFLQRNLDMKLLHEEENDLLYDMAEDNVAIDVMVHKDTDESKWLLLNSKKGRARGYGQKTEIEHVGDVPITINLITKSNEEIKKAKGVIENASS